MCTIHYLSPLKTISPVSWNSIICLYSAFKNISWSYCLLIYLIVFILKSTCVLLLEYCLRKKYDFLILVLYSLLSKIKYISQFYLITRHSEPSFWSSTVICGRQKSKIPTPFYSYRWTLYLVLIFCFNTGKSEEQRQEGKEGTKIY